MNNLKKSRLFSVIEAAISAVMLVGVKFLVPVCSGMVEMASGTQTFMKCHYTSVAVTFFAVLLLVNSIAAVVGIQAFVPGIVAIAGAVLVFLVFSDNMGIGICAKPEMACHMTAPVMKLCAVLEIFAGVAMIVFSLKEEKRG